LIDDSEAVHLARHPRIRYETKESPFVIYEFETACEMSGRALDSESLNVAILKTVDFQELDREADYLLFANRVPVPPGIDLGSFTGDIWAVTGVTAGLLLVESTSARMVSIDPNDTLDPVYSTSMLLDSFDLAACTPS
jgi:hypothetical protein